jgi:hypothetical protein
MENFYMSQLATQVLDKVTSKEEAQEIVSALLTAFVSEKAFEKIEKQSVTSKQSIQETMRRLTSNLFVSLNTRK